MNAGSYRGRVLEAGGGTGSREGRSDRNWGHRSEGKGMIVQRAVRRPVGTGSTGGYSPPHWQWGGEAVDEQGICVANFHTFAREAVFFFISNSNHLGIVFMNTHRI